MIANLLCAFLEFSSTGFYGCDDRIIFLAEKFLTFVSAVVLIQRVGYFDKGEVHQIKSLVDTKLLFRYLGVVW